MSNTGWLSFSSASEDSAGSFTYGWGNTYPITNVLADDGDVAFAQNGDTAVTGTRYSNRLQVSSVSGDIPSFGAITGIEVYLDRAALGGSSTAIYTQEMYLTWGGSLVGNNLADAVAWNRAGSFDALPGSYEAVYFGGEWEMWGSGLTLSDIYRTPSSLGVSLQAKSVDSDASTASSAYVDAIQIRIFYSPGAMLSVM